MSTNASQTLFRFRSLRNPELATTKDNPRFITRENYVGGFFDDILKDKTDQNQTKLTYLTSRAKEFKSQNHYISTEDILKSKYNYLYNLKFPQLIAEITEIFQNKNAQQVTENITLTTEQVKVLWDNLIYQVLTEENFYLKEKIFEILRKRNYFTFIYNKAENQATKEDYDKVKNAKIVMPDELFVDGVKQRPKLQISHSILTQLQQKNEKLQTLTQAKAEREKLIELKTEFSKAQTIYQKNYAKALKQEQATYEESIRVEREAYELRLLQAEANLAADVTEAQRKLALANVVKPDYDTFNFTFREELDTTFLEEKLSSDSLTMLDNVLSKKTINIDLEENQEAERPSGLINFDQDEFESFNDVLKTIDEKIALQDQLIIANTEIEKQQFVNVGGVLLPISSKINETSTYKLILVRVYNNRELLRNFNIDLVIPDGWSVVNGKLTIKNANGYETFEKDYDNQSGNTVSFQSLLGGNIDSTAYSLISELKFEVFFSNGAKGEFVAYKVEYDNRTGTEGVLNIIYNDTNGSGGTNNNTYNSSENNFIPSGFGVRRLGIVDYLKVEQSTHAYVPGEVAHIENIMAREYREKSTRRLSRTEDTTTSSSETEREQLTDTTTTTRFEMQTEIAKIMSETTDIATYANGKKWGIEMGASFANNRSKEESSRAATTQAQDITARALDRIVSKVKEERVRKAVEEFEENNMHGFDNRQGDQHVVGVYRWVDKIMKNQIFNYGKRMMFEFMIPQPSKIHRLAMVNMNPTEVIEKPIDPRKAEDWHFDLNAFVTATGIEKITQFNALKYWAGVYNVELPNYTDEIYIGKAFSFVSTEAGNGKDNWDEIFAKDDFIEIPEGYITKKARASISFPSGDSYNKISVSVGNRVFYRPNFNVAPENDRPITDVDQIQLNISPFTGSIPISISQMGLHTGNVNIEVKCELTEYGRRLLFNKIIEAYEEALTTYEQKVKEAGEIATNIKETNANFYRQIESDVLKHNCMAYLVDPNALGTDLILNGDRLNDIQVKLTKSLDEYTSLVKFMEQAFEWDIMSYNFYPYFWGAKKDWGELYQSESIDPLFRSFLQSGMARVVVTVKPGFEDAVQFYMSTGKIWSGGEVPVIGDPMYLSIVDEMREPTGEKVGKFWMTRIPTSLNILQAESIGLKVEQALPYTIEEKTNCENPDLIIDSEKFPFKNENALLNGGSSSNANNEIEEVISGDWTDTTSVD